MSTLSVSKVYNDVQHTFTVPQSTFGIHDTLKATVTVTNVGIVSDTLLVNYGWFGGI
jgi:hypothetical protein